MTGSAGLSTPGCARAPVGASATPAARSRALQPVLLRISHFSSVTFDASPPSLVSPGSRTVPPLWAAAAPLIDRLDRSEWKGPDHIAPPAPVKATFRFFAAGLPPDRARAT